MAPHVSSLPALGRQAPGAAPPRRVLLLLAGLVLLAHALLLDMAPTDFAPALNSPSKQAPTLMTRRIDMPPPANHSARAPAAEPAARPRVRLATKPPARPPSRVEPASPPPDGATPAEAAPEPADVAMEMETASQEAAGKETAGATEPGPPTTVPPEPPADPASPADKAPTAPPSVTGQTPVTAMTLPASAQLSYTMTGQAKGMNYHAQGEMRWLNNGDSYDVRMSVSALFLGSRSMASQGQVGLQGLAPSRFSDKSRTEVAAHFEPDKGQVSFSANTPAVAWVEGGQDRVSVFLQLGGMLAGNPAGFPDGSRISIYTVGPRDANTWTFQVEGAELLRLPFGELATLKLSRQLRHEYDQKLEIWFAPALGYLPVRNKITETNGDFVDQQLSAWRKP